MIGIINLRRCVSLVPIIVTNVFYDRELFVLLIYLIIFNELARLLNYYFLRLY